MSLELLQKEAREGFHDVVTPTMTTEHFQFLDTLVLHTYETAIKDCLRAQSEVLSAWNVPGISPSFHKYSQEKLMNEWPVLAKALMKMSALLPNNK